MEGHLHVGWEEVTRLLCCATVSLPRGACVAKGQGLHGHDKGWGMQLDLAPYWRLLSGVPKANSGSVIHWKDSQNSLKPIILKVTFHYNERMDTD